MVGEICVVIVSDERTIRGGSIIGKEDNTRELKSSIRRELISSGGGLGSYERIARSEETLTV